MSDTGSEPAEPPAVKGAPVSSTLNAALLKAIRAERARAGLTQSELAERLGWHRNTIAKIEAGDRQLAAHELVDLCQALAVPLTTLLVQADPRDRQILGL
jgi:transcriptional regulator with XRE-family HTH domain